MVTFSISVSSRAVLWLQLRAGQLVRSAGKSGQQCCSVLLQTVVTMEAGQCWLCGVEGVAECPHCRAVCSCPAHLPAHQVSPASCRPVVVSRIPGRGRALLAARDLAPLEPVLVEQAAVAGPGRDTATATVCVECLNPLHTDEKLGSRW